ncbi:AAA family ATPase [Streptomyces sp. p1417]|uniref:AAA family ATPase n=1 Tax=Streptomyces typhae TaxID=2681492 RepID=A0A6L6X7T9_9ACTN|nr:LuxR family transcriptional regulator [Streptomyces typhae]MVO89801.1 AAA family ATPase [Streptomyces typhae]
MLTTVETRSVSPVFVGRAGELGALDDALARAEAPTAGPAGEPQALLIGGEAGVGKTRLLEEFAAGACVRGAVVAVGGCVEIGADGLPFAPFSTALRTLRQKLPEQFAAAASGQEEELARLLPELCDAVPRPGTGGRNGEEAMARLFELTARLLEATAAEHTVVLAIEDLHWADASTRHLLSYLFRTLRRGRLVVLATYRSDDIHRRHPLRPLLAELDRLRTVRRVEVSRFNRDEVGRQMAGILAAEPAPALVDDIFERSDGNAFFVEELAVASHGGSCAGLTDSLRDLLLVRVEELPENAQRVARMVAEGGSTVEYDLLAEVAQLSEDDLLDALRDAVGANILIPSRDNGGYRFRHSLVREAVGDDLLPGERSRINRRFATALEADPALVAPDQRTTRLAGYWYHAHDAAKALPAVLDASVEARRRHAYAEQLRLLERAMEIWDGAPDDVRVRLRPVDYTEVYPPCGCDPETTSLRYLDLMAEAAVAGRLCGERERALKITKRALRLLDDDTDEPDALRAAWFWVQRSRLVQSLARGDGWKELATAQDLVRGLPPSVVHAEVLAMVAGWSMLHEPGPDAFAAAEQAVEYARMVGARDIELTARLTLGGLMVDAGDTASGFAELFDVREQVVASGSVGQIGRTFINLPSVLEGAGRSREAVELLDEGIRLAQRYGLLESEPWMWSNHAESLYALGRWQEAAESARRAGLSAKPRGGACLRLAHLALARGDIAEAGGRLAESRKHFGTHDPLPQNVLPLRRVAIGVAAGEGRILDARAELARAVAEGFPPGTQRYGWPLLLAAATAEADARGLAVAEPGRADTLDLIRTTAKSLPARVPVWQAYELWVRAELLRAEGRATPDDWLAVLTATGGIERPYDLARVRHRLAESLLASGVGATAGAGAGASGSASASGVGASGSAGPAAGSAAGSVPGSASGGGDAERDRAAELLRQAGAVAEHLGARPLADAVARLARRARLSLTGTPPPAPAGSAEALGLTSRERDVLRLVSVGRTNRQIAEELFISPKTASVHVSNILGKLGVAGRGEAAALAHRLHLFDAP